MAYSKFFPSPISEKKVDEACLQNFVNAAGTELCSFLHVVIVDQGCETCVNIRTCWDADFCHGEDGEAAAAAVDAFHF